MVDTRMNFGRAPAASPTQRSPVLFDILTPEGCWCTCTIELSIRINLVVTGLGTCRLPALRQGLKRLQGFLAAAPRGKSYQRAPVLGTQKVPHNQSIYCAAAGRSVPSGCLIASDSTRSAVYVCHRSEVRTEIADLLKKKRKIASAWTV